MRAEIITLTESNLSFAAHVGAQRRIAGVMRQAPGKYGIDNRNGWQWDIEGAIGELAVAKYLNLFWDGAFGDYLAKDVDELQVRATSLQSGNLILHQEDGNDDTFILAIIELPAVFLHGWISGTVGKAEENWRETERPAYFVSREKLHAMQILKEAYKK